MELLTLVTSTMLLLLVFTCIVTVSFNLFNLIKNLAQLFVL